MVVVEEIQNMNVKRILPRFRSSARPQSEIKFPGLIRSSMSKLEMPHRRYVKWHIGLRED